MRAGLLSLALLVVLLPGCAGCLDRPKSPVAASAPPAAEPAATNECLPSEGQVRIAVESLPVTLDWNRSHPSSGRNYPVIHAMMRGLTRLDSRRQPQPDLASHWEIQTTEGPNPRQIYTFHLRPGVVWSDGKTPLRARDFVVGWRRAIRGQEPSELSEILGADEILALRADGSLSEAARKRAITKALEGFGVEAVDDATLRVTLKHPAAYFLSRVAYAYTYFPAPSADVEGKSDEELEPYFNRPSAGKPLVLGAFRLAKWVPDASIELVPNPHFSEAPGEGAIRKVTVVKERLSTVNYEKCKADFLFIEDVSLLPSMRGRADLHRQPLLSTYLLGFGTQQLSLPMRKAVAHALDRPRLLQNLLSESRLAVGLLPPEMPGALGAADPRAAALPGHDQAKARQLLAEAGYAGEELSLLVKADGSFLPEGGIADQIRQQLAAVGVNVKVVTTTKLTDDVKTTDGRTRHHMHLRRIGADYAHPHTFFLVFGPQGSHFTEWEKIDGGGPQRRLLELMREGAAESDPARLAEIYGKAEVLLLAEHAVVVPIYYPDRYYRSRPWLEGLEIDAFNFLTIRGMRQALPSATVAAP